MIYYLSKSVAAGPFEINDLYPSGSSGIIRYDWKVLMVVSNINRTFASLPVLQREGHFTYSVTGGEYRAIDNNVDKTKPGQFTLVYGLPVWHYCLWEVSWVKIINLTLKAGKNLGSFGAVSVDVTG